MGAVPETSSAILGTLGILGIVAALRRTRAKRGRTHFFPGNFHSGVRHQGLDWRRFLREQRVWTSRLADADS